MCESKFMGKKSLNFRAGRDPYCLSSYKLRKCQEYPGNTTSVGLKYRETMLIMAGALQNFWNTHLSILIPTHNY